MNSIILFNIKKSFVFDFIAYESIIKVMSRTPTDIQLINESRWHATKVVQLQRSAIYHMVHICIHNYTQTHRYT